MLDRLHQDVVVALSGDRGEPRVGIRPGDGAIDDDEVLASVGLHCLFAGEFSGLASGGLEGVMVVERDEVEDEVFQCWRMTAGQ